MTRSARVRLGGPRLRRRCRTTGLRIVTMSIGFGASCVGTRRGSGSPQGIDRRPERACTCTRAARPWTAPRRSVVRPGTPSPRQTCSGSGPAALLAGALREAHQQPASSPAPSPASSRLRRGGHADRRRRHAPVPRWGGAGAAAIHHHTVPILGSFTTSAGESACSGTGRAR
jgi:hypothetical protein